MFRYAALAITSYLSACAADIFRFLVRRIIARMPSLPIHWPRVSYRGRRRGARFGRLTGLVKDGADDMIFLISA